MPDLLGGHPTTFPERSGAVQPQAAEIAKMFTTPEPARRGPVPVWLVTVISALVFVVAGVGGLLAYRFWSRSSQPVTPSTKVESPIAAPAQAAGSAVQRLLLENLEVTGLRLTEDSQKKMQVRFVVVNHSPAPLNDVAGTVTLRPLTSQPGGGVVGVFAFRIPELGPYESREMQAPLEAKMRVYELPDWQFMRADLLLTSPMQPLFICSADYTIYTLSIALRPASKATSIFAAKKFLSPPPNSAS